MIVFSNPRAKYWAIKYKDKIVICWEKTKDPKEVCIRIHGKVHKDMYVKNLGTGLSFIQSKRGIKKAEDNFDWINIKEFS